MAVEMWAQVAQSRENFEFLVKICPYGSNPLERFYKIRHGEGVPGSYPHAIGLLHPFFHRSHL